MSYSVACIGHGKASGYEAAMPSITLGPIDAGSLQSMMLVEAGKKDMMKD